MSETPSPQSSARPYIWAVVILILSGLVIALAILKLRPTADPIVIIGGILAGLTPTTAAVLALMKSNETHLSVNGRLDAWMAEHAKAARSEGVIQGTTDEQNRVAIETARTVPAPATHSGPVEVKIVAPIPRKETEET